MNNNKRVTVELHLLINSQREKVIKKIVLSVFILDNLELCQRLKITGNKMKSIAGEYWHIWSTSHLPIPKVGKKGLNSIVIFVLSLSTYL